ncbi:hypothetical protein ACA910_007063 [Epithemia clementina (nom. ined.)]
MVAATCMVMDKNGYQLDLSVLPEGIEYDDYTDILSCTGPDSCRSLTITGCTLVNCHNTYACHSTQLVNNDQVICAYSRACQEMNVEQGHIIVCNATDYQKVQKPCLGATIEIRHVHHDDQPGGVLHCVGPGACHGPPHRPLAVRVGAKGTLRCENNINRYFSCHTVLIEVNHAVRACYNELHHEQREHEDDAPPVTDCAVTCANEYDCHKDQMEFYVPPS